MLGGSVPAAPRDDVRVAGFEGGGSADEPSKTTIHGRKFETAA